MSDTAPLPDTPEVREALNGVLAALERSRIALARFDAAIETYKQDARRLAESLGAGAGRSDR